MFFKKKHDKIQKVAENKEPISNEGFKLTIHTEKDGKKFNALSASLGISLERKTHLEREVNKILDTNSRNPERAYNSLYLADIAKFCHNLEEFAYMSFGLGQMTGRMEGGMGGRMIHIQLGGSGQSSMNQQEDEDNDSSIEALIKRSEKINGKYGEPKKDNGEK